MQAMMPKQKEQSDINNDDLDVVRAFLHAELGKRRMQFVAEVCWTDVHNPYLDRLSVNGDDIPDSTAFADELQSVFSQISASITFIEALVRRGRVLRLCDMEKINPDAGRGIRMLPGCQDEGEPIADCLAVHIGGPKNRTVFCGAGKAIAAPERNAIVCLVKSLDLFFRKADNACLGQERSRALTERQFDVVNLSCQGHSNTQVAQCLGVSEVTVRFHLQRARELYGVLTNQQLKVAFVQDYGLFSV